MTVAAAIEAPQSLIVWRYLWWALAAIAVMIAAIVASNFWLLDFIHVFTGLLWTGIDLFMGFVLGPILRRMDLTVRREVVRRLVPRTLFLMPALAIIAGTTGWFLAVKLGYTALPWPDYGWVAAALVLVTLMTIQGLVLSRTGQRVRLPRIAEVQSGHEKDRHLDAALFLCRRLAGHDADCDHRRHDALSYRRLTGSDAHRWVLAPTVQPRDVNLSANRGKKQCSISSFAAAML